MPTGSINYLICPVSVKQNHNTEVKDAMNSKREQQNLVIIICSFITMSDHTTSSYFIDSCININIYSYK